VAEVLQAGITRHRAGNLPEAEACYRKVLDLAPEHADALHLLGVIFYQYGEDRSAVEFIRRAIQRNGKSGVYYLNLGNALLRLGSPQEAAAAYRQAVHINPASAEAHTGLGAALRASGRLGEAQAAHRRAISIRPEYAEAHFNLGASLADQGLVDEAVVAYRRAIALKPDYAEAHSQLGRILRAQGRRDEAVAAFRETARLNPGSAEAYFNLGAPLYEQGKFSEAAAAYREAIRINPDHSPTYLSLGATLRAQGKLDEAIAAYRKSIQLTPDYAEAHKNLALALRELGHLSEARAAIEQAIRLEPRKPAYRRYLGEMGRFIAEGPHLAAMEAMALDSASFSVGDRIELHFALAKAYEYLGRHAEAFSQLRDGNALKRKGIEYDEASTLGVLERTEAVFGPELFETHRDVGLKCSVPVFIIGMPRSGTSLVEQILASHPLVVAAGEIKQFGKVMMQFRSRFDDSAHYPEMVLGMKRQDFHDFGSRYLQEIKQIAPNAARITDKMPANFILTGLIHLALPDASIIHVVRDPVDTCLSCFSTSFSAEQNHTYDLAELGRYYRRYQALMSHWNRILPAGRLLNVQYEDVVSDLEGQARRIITHCGLEWDRRCLSFHRTERPVFTASATQVRQPIYDTSIGRRQRVPESFLRPLLAELGILNSQEGPHA
jgi:tetratricopeptide (TPR) repeat protein